MAVVFEEPLTGLTVGQLLTAARKARKMTQQTLANELGINVATVSSWENGHTCPDVLTWRKIVLLLDADYLSDVRELPGCWMAA